MKRKFSTLTTGQLQHNQCSNVHRMLSSLHSFSFLLPLSGVNNRSILQQLRKGNKINCSNKSLSVCRRKLRDTEASLLKWANIMRQSIESSAFCRRSVAHGQLSFYSPDQCHRQLTVQAGLLLLLTCIGYSSTSWSSFSFIHSLPHTIHFSFCHFRRYQEVTSIRSSTSECHFLHHPLLKLTAATGHV